MKDKKETRLHFVGIGGIGMSGIAEVFSNQGYQVSGSDLSESDVTKRLSGIGIRISIGHRAENVIGTDVVVTSSAIKPTNPEIIEARKLRIPVIPRAEMLGELMRGKTGIAVAGTHGKTTTTSMLATILTVAKFDPTLVIGGKVDSLGGNAKLGTGQYVVAEADESDGSFLHLPATYAVVTNIDNDHLDYFGSLSAIDEAFVNFVGKLPFYGAVAVCGEDPGVRRCLTRWTKPYVTYGFSSFWDVYGDAVARKGMGSTFKAYARDGAGKPHHLLGEVELSVPGRHNVLNALGALSIALEAGIPFETIAGALKQFTGVRRRFEVRWQDQGRKRAIVDDYGHHPTEIAATLDAARELWPGRILTIFQPHRFSRTLHCRDGFLTAFKKSDLLLVTDIYAAGEEPIEGIDAKSLAHDIGRAPQAPRETLHVGDLGTAKAEIMNRFKDGDLILCLGAGSITKLADQLATSITQA